MGSSLIVTLKLDDGTQHFFNALRKNYFPKHWNYINAHCTLIHKLPFPAEAEYIQRKLEASARRAAFNMMVSDVDHTGNGVSYRIVSTELQQLHLDLQADFATLLMKRDRQILQPHITIQNKVTAFKSAALHKKLTESFLTMNILATGFCTWLYSKGKWQHVQDLDFHAAKKL